MLAEFDSFQEFQNSMPKGNLLLKHFDIHNTTVIHYSFAKQSRHSGL